MGLTALASSEYSDVLVDLSKDESFDVEKYSSNRADFETDEEFFTLNVEQIAESSAGELLIYVYNPSASVYPITARKISLSTAVLVNQNWQLYDLELLSSSSVFSKYRVKDFKVKSDVVRYYDITSIYRNYDSSLGDEIIAGGTTDCVAIEVAKVYTAITSGDNVSYACEGTQVITVTASYAGFILYGAGVFGTNRCDAHFIAFTTDKQIDELIEADVTWKSQSYLFESEYNFDFWKVITGRGEEQTEVTKTWGDMVPDERTILSNEKASYKGDGWFAKKYTWDRIQSVEEFLTTTETNESLKNDVADMKWVLRFTETDYDVYQSSNSNGTWSYQSASGTKVSEIGILRLKFKVGKDTFNLGVVSNLITGDDIPDNPYDPGIEFPGFPGFDFFSYVWNCVVKLFNGTAD
ncbi:MAG: hypothetical protein K2L37_01940, partial [Lactobacillus sp.]|nr:hypothetical protein [Lactobacillus sp.]